jgi:hypothetical protein
MGFLSVYSGVKRIVVDSERDYWVDILEHVSQGGREAAERSLSAMTFVDGKTVPNPDVAKFRQLSVLAAVSAWNLDDEDGTIWPLTLRSIQNLPGVIFDQLWEAVDSMNSPRSSEESQQFRDGDVSSDPHGDGRTPVVEHVPDRERVLEKPRPHSR